MSRTILVVDDDARLRNRLSGFLRREGYDAHALSGGEELRAFLQERPADLVVLDLVMPGEDGLSLTRYLRENFAIGILILTGKGDPVDASSPRNGGRDFSQPFNLRELLARLRSISAASKAEGFRPRPAGRPNPVPGSSHSTGAGSTSHPAVSPGGTEPKFP